MYFFGVCNVTNLILGMGNPILSDDGIGMHIALALDGCFADTDVRTCALIGLDLLDAMAGYDRVFVIDALQDARHPQGTVVELTSIDDTRHLFSSHGMHFFEMIRLGRDLGLTVPDVAGIFGVAIASDCPFGENLSVELTCLKNKIVQDITNRIEALIK
jgi:hydrogenase maturation protease